jgi:hypothetical protein
MKWPELAQIEQMVPPAVTSPKPSAKREQRWKVLFPEFDVEPEPA